MLRFVSKDASWLYSINTQQFSGLLFRERCSSYIKDDKILSDDQFLDWKLRRSYARMLFCCSSSECNMPRSSSNYWSKNNDTVRDQLGWGEKNKHNVILWQRDGTREDFFLEKEIFSGSWGILLEFYFFPHLQIGKVIIMPRLTYNNMQTCCGHWLTDLMEMTSVLILQPVT